MNNSPSFAKTADLNVVYALDDNFAILTSVSIESLLANNVGEFERITIHILDSGICENNKLNLESIAQRYTRKKSAEVEVKFYRMDNISQLEHLPRSERYPVAIYFRFLISVILPKDIITCLYLDGDTIVCTSLKDLMRQDISDYDICGVLDLGMSVIDSDNRGRRGKYINSGVLLINLVRWRENNILEILLKYANENASTLLWPDQDVINAIIPEQSKLLLSPCYNNLNTSKHYSAIVRQKSEAYQIYGITAIRKAKRTPVIIHYGGSEFAIGNLVYVKQAKTLFERYRRNGPYAKFRYSEIVNRGNGLSYKTLLAKWVLSCIPIPIRGHVRDIYKIVKQLVLRKT